MAIMDCELLFPRGDQVVVEPRDATSLPEAIDRFNGAVDASTRTGVGGAILLAVCRGRLSEGVCLMLII